MPSPAPHTHTRGKRSPSKRRKEGRKTLVSQELFSLVRLAPPSSLLSPPFLTNVSNAEAAEETNRHETERERIHLGLALRACSPGSLLLFHHRHRWVGERQGFREEVQSWFNHPMGATLTVEPVPGCGQPVRCRCMWACGASV